MSAIVPWNDPGGTPCCCGFCTNTELQTAFDAGQIGARHWSSNLSPDIDRSAFYAASTSNQNFQSTFDLVLRRDFVSGGNTVTWMSSSSFILFEPVSYTFTNPFTKFANTCRSTLRIVPQFQAARFWSYLNGDTSTATYINRDVTLGVPGPLLFLQDGGTGYPQVNDGPPTAAQPKLYGAGPNLLELNDLFFGAFFSMQIFFDNDETRASSALTGNITIFGETVNWGHNWNPSAEFSGTIEAHIAIPPAP